MRIEIKWHRLIPLRDGSRHNLIYRIDDLDAIPCRPGVYVRTMEDDCASAV